MTTTVNAPYSDEEIKRDALSIANVVYNDALDVLERAKVEATEQGNTLSFERDRVISKPKLIDSILYALRDLDRIEIDQDRKFSLTKYVGYIVFWFAKLKPIGDVVLITDGTDPGQRELKDINERMGLVLMQKLLLRVVRENSSAMPPAWRACENVKCSKSSDAAVGQCFFSKITRYFEAEDGKYNTYLAYTLRFRPASPYILVAILDQAIFMACEHATPPIFSLPG